MAKRRKRTRPDKLPFIAGISGAIVVVLLLAGYFAVLPSVQSSNYLAAVRSDQPSLSKRMHVLIDSFESGSLTSSDETINIKQTENDIKTAKADLAATKSQLDSSEARLTSFHTYPLLGWLGSYKKAADVDKLEHTFISESRQSLVELGKIVAYAQQNIDFMKKIHDAGIDSSDSSDVHSIADLQAYIEKAYSTLNDALTDFKKTSPPETLKEVHEYNVSFTEKTVGTFKQMIHALKANDFSTVEKLSTHLESEANKPDKKLDDLEDKVITDSLLRHQFDKIVATDDKLKELLGDK